MIKDEHDVLPADPFPLVSVVIPLYNSASTVEESLQSVLEQTYQNLEIIVVNDGSTDRGSELVSACSDPRVRLISQRNRGLAGARNTGIRESRGRFIAFLDSDDLWNPRKIEQHLLHFERRQAVGISFSASILIDERSKPIGVQQTPKLVNIRPQDILCRNPIGNGSSVVIRRDALEEIKFRAFLYEEAEDYWFDDTFRQSEDVECWLRLAVLGSWLFEGLPEPLTFYRLTSSGLSANIDQQYASWQKFLNKASCYAPELIRRWGRRAKGYQLRYLARRSILEGQPVHGMRLCMRSIISYPFLLLEEPFRTGITVSAALIAVMLPKRIYRILAAGMMPVVGWLQRLRSSTRSYLQACSRRTQS